MGFYDDDEQRNAYERATNPDYQDYLKFAEIVQQYDVTVRPEHDDIDFDYATLEQLDGREFAGEEEPVLDLDVISDFIVAANEFADFDGLAQVDDSEQMVIQLDIFTFNNETPDNRLKYYYRIRLCRDVECIEDDPGFPCP